MDRIDLLERARKTALRTQIDTDRLRARMDYMRGSPFTAPGAVAALVPVSVAANRRAQLAGRIVAYLETGALFYNARDFR